MIIAVRTTVRLTHVVALLVLAVVLSYLTAPFQSRLSARLGHGLATALVPPITFAVMVAIAFAVSYDAPSQTARLASVLNDGPGYRVRWRPLGRLSASARTSSLPWCKRIAQYRWLIRSAFCYCSETDCCGDGSAFGPGFSRGANVGDCVICAFSPHRSLLGFCSR